MNKFKLPITADLCFIFASVFFVAYAVFLNAKLNLAACLALSTIVAFIISACVAVVLIKLKDKKFISDLNKQEKLLLKDYLILTERSEVIDVFVKYFEKNGSLTSENNTFLTLKNKNVAVIPIFKYEKVTTADVVEVYRKLNHFKVVVLGCEFTAETLNLIKNESLNISVFNIDDIYFSLKSSDLLPPLNTEVKNKKSSLKNLKKFFNKKYFKYFFISGIITLLTSSISYFPVYYVVFGSVMLIISAACKFFSPENQPPKGINI